MENLVQAEGSEDAEAAASTTEERVNQNIGKHRKCSRYGSGYISVV